MEQVNKMYGVTLLELMIATAICGILSAIAVPSYQSVVKQIRQQAIKTEMLNIHLQQQSYYLKHQKYGAASDLVFPDSNYYKVSVKTSKSGGFVVSAVAKRSQKDGSACDVLTINESLQRRPKVCW